MNKENLTKHLMYHYDHFEITAAAVTELKPQVRDSHFTQ